MRASKAVFVALLLAVVVLPAPAAAIGLPGDPPPPPLLGLGASDPPEVTAQAWLVYDETFDVELAADEADTERAIASTTKMMTALVALENAALDQPVRVSEQAAAIGESEIGLQPGEVLTLEELVTIMLIRSANDAAMAVAETVGGSVEGFVDMMNARAAELGLEHTRFANPHGLDEPGHYSSARDLLTIARVGMQHPTFAQAVATREFRLPDAPDGSPRVAETTNLLLREGYDGIIGVKTGFTDEAGRTFVVAAEENGRRLYVVVLGSEGSGAHFRDARALLEWGFEEFRLVQVIIEGSIYGRYRARNETLPLVAQQSSEALVGQRAPEEIVFEPRFDADVPVVVATVDDQELARVRLTAAEPTELPSLGDAFAWVGRYWGWLWGADA
jgi:D-alanyl-D-alanine carboxypeptidase (penicillin-binding protein 5/6)